MKNKGSFLLLLTAFIWGMAFVAQSAAMDNVGPWTFNCVRSIIGGLTLLVLMPFLHKLVPPVHSSTKELAAAGRYYEHSGRQGWLSHSPLCCICAALSCFWRQTYPETHLVQCCSCRRRPVLPVHERIIPPGKRRYSTTAMCLRICPAYYYC